MLSCRARDIQTLLQQNIDGIFEDYKAFGKMHRHCIVHSFSCFLLLLVSFPEFNLSPYIFQQSNNLFTSHRKLEGEVLRVAKKCSTYANSSSYQNSRVNQISHATLRSQVSRAATSDIEMTILPSSFDMAGTTNHSQFASQSYSYKHNSMSISTNLVLSRENNSSKPFSTNQSDDNHEQTEPLSSDSNSYLPSLISERVSVEKKETKEKNNMKKDIKSAVIKDYVFCVRNLYDK